MFDHEGYRSNLKAFVAELERRRSTSIAQRRYGDAAVDEGVKRGIDAAIVRMNPYVKPDPPKREDQVLDEFTDWLAGYVAITGFQATADAFSFNTNGTAKHELAALKRVTGELARLAKKYPEE